MRSKLFVPASRPELFAKALAGEADAISFDLEDAVALQAKPAARSAMQALLSPPTAGADVRGSGLGEKTIIVRVNAVDTDQFPSDLQAVMWPGVHLINLPMLESAEAVVQAANAMEALERERGIDRPIGILANIESPRGLRMAAEIALAHPRVRGLQIGYGDLFSPLGIEPAHALAKHSVRFAVRLAAAEAGVEAYDGAFVNIGDPDGFRADSQAAQSLGFVGRSCIHPSQIASVNEVFRPSDADIAHALRVVAASQDHLGRGVGAFTVDGRLVDGPFITQAEQLVALARRMKLIA
jgi:citrate lyase subunit beta/citryl-CoA lyase